MNRCSRIGPRLSAGKNVSAPTIRITLIKSTVKSGVVTGKVPSEGGTYFLPARFPAIASMGMIIKNRPASMVRPVVTSYHSVFTVSPPKDDPLLAAVEIFLKCWQTERELSAALRPILHPQSSLMRINDIPRYAWPHSGSRHRILSSEDRKS